MGSEAHLTYWLVRLVLIGLAIAGARAAARRLRREQNDLRVVRDEEQAELFARELPPKPSVVHNAIARVACGQCGELTNVDQLDDVDGKRLCSNCFTASSKGSETYR